MSEIKLKMMTGTPCFCHPNGRGTGTAMHCAVIPAQGGMSGRVDIHIDPQETMEAKDRFRWGEGPHFQLDLLGVEEVLMVLRGYQESIRDGKGLFLRKGEKAGSLNFDHVVEPTPGYILTIANRVTPDGETKRLSFHFGVTEGLAFGTALESAMPLVNWGMETIE